MSNHQVIVTAIQKIIKQKENGKVTTFNTYFNNNLFANYTIEENLLHQSGLKSIEQLRKIKMSQSKIEWCETTIYNFKSFKPAEVPSELLPILSFLSFILKNTKVGLYIRPLVISEDEYAICRDMMNYMQEVFGKKFIDLEKDRNEIHLKLQENEFAEEETKKAA